MNISPNLNNIIKNKNLNHCHPASRAPGVLESSVGLLEVKPRYIEPRQRM